MSLSSIIISCNDWAARSFHPLTSLTFAEWVCLPHRWLWWMECDWLDQCQLRKAQNGFWQLCEAVTLHICHWFNRRFNKEPDGPVNALSSHTHTSTPESESEKKARFRNPWFVTFLKNPDKPSHTPAVPHLSPSSHSQTPTQLPAQLSTQYKALLVFCDSIWLSTQAVSRQLCIIVCLWTAGCVQAELNQWHLLGWIYRWCFSLFKRLMTRPRWNLRTDFGQNLHNGIKYKRS